MANAQRTVRVRFDGDAKRLSRAARQAAGDIDRFDKRASKAIGNVASNVTSRSGLIAAAVVAALALLPVAAQLAASGVVLAFGAAFATIGIVAAAQSTKVRREFSALREHVVGELKDISTPFEQALEDIAGIARNTFDAFAPALRDSFRKSAPAIALFVANFAAAFEQLIPAVGPVTDAFAALLGSIGAGLPALFGRISDALVRLSTVVSQNATEFGDLINWLLGAVPAALNIVSAIAEWGAAHQTLSKVLIAGAVALGAFIAIMAVANLTVKAFSTAISIGAGLLRAYQIALFNARVAMALFGVTAKGAAASLGVIAVVVGAVAATIQLTKANLDGYTASVTRAAGSSASTAAKIKVLKDELAEQQAILGDAAFMVGDYGFSWTRSGRELYNASKRAKLLKAEIQQLQQGVGALPPGLQALADAQQRADTSARGQAAALQLVITKLTRLGELTVTRSEATIAFQQAIDDATASIKENGRTLDLNTAKGRANQQALNAIVTTTNQRIDAETKAGAGAARLAALQNAGAIAYTRAARAAGMTAAEIDRYTQKVFGVPGTRVTKLTADKRDAESKLRDVKRQLRDPNLTKERRAKLTAQKEQLERAVKRAKELLASIRDKEVTLTVRQRTLVSRSLINDGRTRSGFAFGGYTGRGRKFEVAGLVHKREYVIPDVDPNEAKALDSILKGGPLSVASSRANRNALTSGAASGPMQIEGTLDLGGGLRGYVKGIVREDKRNTMRRARAGTGVNA